MPEGHVVHRLARELAADLGGRRLSVSSPQGRFAEEADRVDSAMLRRTDAYGKHLLLGLSSGDDIHVHLGMRRKWLRMARAVEDGRIVTVDVADRAAVPEAEARKVYKQERCRDCGSAVVTSTVGGRTAYHCPREQPG